MADSSITEPWGVVQQISCGRVWPFIVFLDFLFWSFSPNSDLLAALWLGFSNVPFNDSKDHSEAY